MESAPCRRRLGIVHLLKIDYNHTDKSVFRRRCYKTYEKNVAICDYFSGLRNIGIHGVIRFWAVEVACFYNSLSIFRRDSLSHL